MASIGASAADRYQLFATTFGYVSNPGILVHNAVVVDRVGQRMGDCQGRIVKGGTLEIAAKCFWYKFESSLSSTDSTVAYGATEHYLNENLRSPAFWLVDQKNGGIEFCGHLVTAGGPRGGVVCKRAEPN